MSRRDDLYAISIGLNPTVLVAAIFILIPLGFSLYLSLLAQTGRW